MSIYIYLHYIENNIYNILFFRQLQVITNSLDQLTSTITINKDYIQ